MERTPNSEQVPRDGPDEVLGRLAIYAASLSDYNHGRLHGAWIEATEDVEVMQSAVDRMLGASPAQRKYGTPAEEWAIHDQEGFGPLVLEEYAGLVTVARLAGGIDEHGPAFAAWAELNGSTDEEVLERFEHAYLGDWPSLTDYAEHLLADFDLDETLDRAVPDGLRPYVQVDAAGLGRDLELGGDIATRAAPDGGLHVFDMRE